MLATTKKNKLGDNVRNCSFFCHVVTVICYCATAADAVEATVIFQEKQREKWISIFFSQFDGSVLRPIANTRNYKNWRNVHQHATGIWYRYMLLRLLHLRLLNHQIGSKLDSIGFCHFINLTVNFLVIIKSEYWTVRKCAFAWPLGQVRAQMWLQMRVNKPDYIAGTYAKWK